MDSMKEQTVKDRHGNKFTINVPDTLDSCIIPNAQRVEREDRLDDIINDWRQIY